MKSSVSDCPSQVFHQDSGGDAIFITYYNSSIEFWQSGDVVSIEDESLEEFIRTIRKGRKEADELLTELRKNPGK